MKNGPKTCMICFSPYRKEIVTLFNQKMRQREIYNKYAPLMKYKSRVKSFYLLIRRHVVENHNQDAVLLPQGVTKATIENFGQRMLELGMAKAETATPDEITFKDVVAANKLVLDSKKLRLSESSMELMLAKMFAPPLKVIEGEVSD